MSERAAFRITPDLRFVYPQPAHEAAFKAVVDAVRGGAGATMIEGEVGTGKSILLRRVEAALKASGRRPRYIPYSELSVPALLDWANSDIGWNAGPGGSSILLLDDAERCSSELLTGLYDLAAARRERPFGPQVVLVGGTSLWPRLLREEPRLAELIATRVTTTPFTADEIGAYIRHRLGVAGRSADLFSPDAIAAIARYSGGVPRLVNQVCSRALLLADIEQAASISPRTIAEAVDDCPASALFPQQRLPVAPADARQGADPEAAALERDADASAAPPEPPSPQVTVRAAIPPALPAAAPDPAPVAEARPKPPEPLPAQAFEPHHEPSQRRKDTRLKFKPPRAQRETSSPVREISIAGTAPAFAGFVPRREAAAPKPAPPELPPVSGERAAFSGFVRRRAVLTASPAPSPEPAPPTDEPRGRRGLILAILLVAAAAAAGGAVVADRKWPEATEQLAAATRHAIAVAAEKSRGVYSEIKDLLRR